MGNRRSELPQTLEECHALILDLYDTIDELQARLAQLERELYGTRRERFIADEQVDDASADEDVHDDDDSDMQVDDDLQDDASLPSSPDADSTPPDDAASPPAKPPRTSSGRRPRVYPPDTPRVRVNHPLDETTVPPELLHNPRARRFYRFVREEVELPQRRIRILEHYQEVIADDDAETEQSTLYVAAVPEPLLESCYASDSLLAYLAVSRFADHLPYYREEDIVRRSGLSIPRSTQWRWMRQLGRVLSPLVENIRQRLLQGRILGIDETPCPMLDATLPNTRKTYLYAQYGDDTQPYVSYYFAEHKTRANIESMLAGFEGVLQSDAYICYELITAASLDRIRAAACWAHGRRKFEPLVANGQKHPQASWILTEIQKLYDIEDRAADLSDLQRLALRQAESRPIVERIHAWMKERQQQERPRSVIRQGVNYFLKRWEAFRRFLEDGAIPIDNNRTEAAIKVPVMGKKAWLFFGNEAAGETAAILYTIVMSCKRHSIDPYAYLLDVMRRIKTASPEELEALLPDTWFQSHPEAYLQQRARESHAAAHRKRTRRARRRAALAKK
jgi:transposase